MFRLLFNHRSKLLIVVEAFALIALAGCGWRTINIDGGWFTWIIFTLIVIEFAFIRYCASVRWYSNAERYEGVELQFKKALSPTLYIILIGCAIFQLIPNNLVLIIIALFLGIIAHVNAILIYLHRKDKDPLPVNYFSHNKNGA